MIMPVNTLKLDLSLLAKGSYGQFTDDVEATRRVCAVHVIQAIETYQLQYVLHWLLNEFYLCENPIRTYAQFVQTIEELIVDKDRWLRAMVDEPDRGILHRTIARLLSDVRLTQVRDGDTVLQPGMLGISDPQIHELLSDLKVPSKVGEDILKTWTSSDE